MCKNYFWSLYFLAIKKYLHNRKMTKKLLRLIVSIVTFIIAFTLAWGAPTCVFVATRNTLLCLGLFVTGMIAAIPFAKISAWCADYDLRK